MQELSQRKAKVLATLIELQHEVEPITKATEQLKNTESMKDSKTFVSVLQKEYGVSKPAIIFVIENKKVYKVSFEF